MIDLSKENLNIKKESNKIAYHSFCGGISIFLINIIDSLMLSIKSENDFAASILSSPFIFLILSSYIGASNAKFIFMSKKAKEDRKSFEKTNNGLDFFLMSTLFFLLTLAYFSVNEIMIFINTKDVLRILAVDYIKCFYIGIPLCIMLSLIGSREKSLGDAKLGSQLMIRTAVLNLIFDPIFIFYLDFGAKGAAMATVLSWLLVLIHIIIVKKYHRIIKIGFDKIDVRSFSALLPSYVLNQVLNAVSFLFVALFINLYSVSVISAYGFTLKLEKAFVIIAVSFSTSIMMIISQNLGNKKRREEVFSYCFKTSLIFNLFISGLLFIFSDNLSSFFNLSVDASLIAKEIFILLFLFIIFPTFTTIYSGYLNVIDKHNIVLLSNVIRIFVILPLSMYILTNLLGSIGIIYSIILTYVLGSLLILGLTFKDFKGILSEKEWFAVRVKKVN